MAISLTRIHANELPVNTPLPFPIFAKSGRLLLAKGCIFPANLAEDLLQVGIYRVSDDSALDTDVLLGDDSGSQELTGLTANVESMQLSFLEAGCGEKTSSHVDYIGTIPGVSLITSLPQRSGRVINLGIGQLVSVRVCTGRFIHGFSTQVICFYKFPQPHVHIEFPAHFKTMVLRHSERVKIRLLALLKTKDGAAMPVSIVELSGSGAAFVSEFSIGSVGDEITLSFNLTLNSSDAIHPFSVEGVIRQARAIRTKKTYRFGVQFPNLTDEQKLIMQACIYENL